MRLGRREGRRAEQWGDGAGGGGANDRPVFPSSVRSGRRWFQGAFKSIKAIKLLGMFIWVILHLLLNIHNVQEIKC